MAVDRMSLRDLYRIVETTPANPVSLLQAKLDAAVRKAYGWTAKQDALTSLLARNGQLAAAEADGKAVLGPGLPLNIGDRSQYVSDDAVGA